MIKRFTQGEVYSVQGSVLVLFSCGSHLANVFKVSLQKKVKLSHSSAQNKKPLMGCNRFCYMEA